MQVNKFTINLSALGDEEATVTYQFTQVNEQYMLKLIQKYVPSAIWSG